jgi:hypothetical protein
MFRNRNHARPHHRPARPSFKPVLEALEDKRMKRSLLGLAALALALCGVEQAKGGSVYLASHSPIDYVHQPGRN